MNCLALYSDADLHRRSLAGANSEKVAKSGDCKVQVCGEGVSHSVAASIPVSFEITSHAGTGDPHISIQVFI